MEVKTKWQEGRKYAGKSKEIRISIVFGQQEISVVELQKLPI